MWKYVACEMELSSDKMRPCCELDLNTEISKRVYFIVTELSFKMLKYDLVHIK